MPKSRPDQLDADWVRSLIRLGSRANTWIYRVTGGRLGGKWRFMAGFKKPVPVLLLTTTGRRSGKERTVPLLYLRDGVDIVVVASTGGLPDHPAWYHNLSADPEVSVQVGSDVSRRRGRTATDDERDRLWPRLVEMYADFETYQQWTADTREIPVVILEPLT
jgi:deazaflavin-dependent oxidoreductase (nitroreductase family)